MPDIYTRNDCPVLDASRCLVFGAARSGMAAARLLRLLGRDVFVRDEGQAGKLAAQAKDLGEIGASHAFGPAEIVDLHEVGAVVLSPGIPVSHPFLRAANGRGIPIYSEIELGYACCPAPIVGVTGSNGKTTTTTLVAHFLRESGVPALEAGNIGAPLCEVVLREEAALPGAVLSVELSSFQLETTDRFRPKAALVLNITPDHLDRYGGSMDAYAAAKARITMRQTGDDALIVNQDDSRCLALHQGSRAQPWAFSLEREVERGGWLSEDTLMVGDGRMRSLATLEELPLRGMHNVANILAAAAAATFMKVPIDAMRRAARSAKPAPHRLEFVGEVGGVSYYNDSKATNLDAVMRALESFSEPIILLAGGRDKGSPFEQCAAEVGRRVKRLIVFGEAAGRIGGAWGEAVPTLRVENLAQAFEAASSGADLGDVVLLSPACASFDQYANYEERGRHFAACVEAIRSSSR